MNVLAACGSGAASDVSLLELCISTLGGNTISVNVAADSTMLKVKNTIEDIEGIETVRQKLLFGEDVLRDFQTLSQCGLENHASLSLCVIEDLRAVVFQELDLNGDGRLSSGELYVLAAWLGFPDGLDEFQGEYSEVCQDSACDPEVGISSEAFLRLISDEDSDFYLLDSDVPRVLKDLSSKVDSSTN